MITILIADDHQLMREGLKKIVQEEKDMKVIGEAGNGHDVLHFVEETPPDVIVMDMMMPGLNGFDVLKELHRTSPEIPVLVLSMYPEELYATRVLKAGGAGYITKESAPNELVDAIRKVAHGGKYISLAVAEQLASESSAHNKKLPHELLSDRELQTLCLLAAGKSVQHIADDLNIGLATVKTYRARIFEKLSINSLAELIHYAVEHRLIA
jgi:DNA-binding NarL/FixJ family response regulator